MKSLLTAALLGSALFAAPAAFAQQDKAHDSVVRAEAQIKALNPADAGAASAVDYQTAQQRMMEAKTAEDKKRYEESLWRSEEASVQADIVQEKIKLRGLERTVSEIETGIATLRREINS
jgi:Ni/Co efflux regulator RcnB